MPRKLLTQKGDQFGRWTVIEPNICKDKALCRCECGTEKSSTAANCGMVNGKAADA